MDASEKWRVVLIDDEEDIRDVLTLALTDAGFEVASAHDGKTGLELCRDFSPQIVITDIRMPGMSGLQVLEHLKDSRPETEVIVATAFGEMDVAIRALQLDASDFITKPISDQALQMALKRARERYSARQQLADYTRLLEQENVETTQELLTAIAFQRGLIDSSMDGIIGCDGTKKVVTFNRAMEKMLGYSRFEVLGRMDLADFFPPGGADEALAAMSGKSHGGPGRLFMFETRLLAAGGQTIPAQVSATPIVEQGEAEGLVLFLRDLRDIRRLERDMADQARILHQDKMMSLGRLAASVVHEINNPLSGILNYARLMRKIILRGPLSPGHLEKFRGYLDLVESETDRCSQIVSGLLAFSRRSQPEFTEVDIEDLISRSVALSRHKLEMSNIELDLTMNSSPPKVSGDRNQLQQCLINLIFNAIDAMPRGGRLGLAATLDGQRQEVVITVRDTGSGIAEADLPHIFEPFFTTKREGYGVGLGLSTVFGIIEHHNGRVEVESRPGQGSVFTIHLPASGGSH